MYRIIGADGREYGPVSVVELRQWIAEGRANAQSQVQSEINPGWRPLGTFPEFVADLGAANLRAPAAFATIPMGSAAASRTNGLAIAGLILGIFSILTFCCFCAAIPCGVLGLIFSCMSLSQIKHNPLQAGKGMAIAGVVLSILGLLLWLAGFIFGVASALMDPTMFK